MPLTVRARPPRHGYGGVTSGGVAATRRLRCRGADPGGARSNPGGGARPRARTRRHLPGRRRRRRHVSSSSRPEVLPVAARLLGFSTAAADFLVRHPEEVATLADVAAATRPALDAELVGDIARLGADDGLRVFRRRAMLRVAARDLDGASLEDVVEEISRVAEACLEAACRLAVGDHRMAVIGLGKLGGGELNYASDVDLIFVHAESGTEAQEQAERAAAMLIRLAGRTNGGGDLAPGRPGAPPGRPRRGPVAEPGGDARLLRAPVRHVGTPGDDQGQAGRRRPVDRVGVRRGRGALRLPGGARRPRDRRRPAHQGPSGGVHPPARQGAHRGQAGPRRDPRR